MVLCKIGFLEISQNSQENTAAKISFLIKNPLVAASGFKMYVVKIVVKNVNPISFEQPSNIILFTVFRESYRQIPHEFSSMLNIKSDLRDKVNIIM